MRLQILLSGQIEAATLPEPLVTLAEKNGCIVLADDDALPYTQTVFIFSKNILANHISMVQQFHQAVARANLFIREYPDSARIIMEQYIRIPEPLKGVLPVPSFPELDVPAPVILDDIQNWLISNKVLKQKIEYHDIVNEQWRRTAAENQ